MPRSKRKIAVYLRRIQGAHGGWPLFHDGDFDMSASVKAYFALKMIGDDADAPHMRRAREAILRAAARRSATCSPACCSRSTASGAVARGAGDAGRDHAAAAWFPFHIDKMSYWARTVIVPLLVLQALKPRARNPRGVAHRRTVPGAGARRSAPPTKAPHQKWSWFLFFRGVDIGAARRRAAVSEAGCASARSTRPSPSSPSASTARTGSARSSRRWPTA